MTGGAALPTRATRESTTNTPALRTCTAEDWHEPRPSRPLAVLDRGRLVDSLDTLLSSERKSTRLVPVSGPWLVAAARGIASQRTQLLPRHASLMQFTDRAPRRRVAVSSR